MNKEITPKLKFKQITLNVFLTEGNSEESCRTKELKMERNSAFTELSKRKNLGELRFSSPKFNQSCVSCVHASVRVYMHVCVQLCAYVCVCMSM